MKRSVRKSAAQWAELVGEYSAGSESERDFCKRLSIKLVTLRKWRYRFQSNHKPAKTTLPSGFVQVNLPVHEVAASHISSAVLCIGNDIRLECPANFNVASLARLALAVHHGR